MFLNALRERNRELFLEVCIHASMANEILEEEEKEMVYAYCREMNIEEHIPDIGSFEVLVTKLSEQAGESEKKIIALEILGLVRADGNFDQKERSFFDKLIKGLQIEPDIADKLEGLLEQYTAVYKELYAAIYE